MLFRIAEITKSFGGEKLLKGASFQVNPSEKVALVGRNGAGKSTIFRMLTAEISPDSGEVITAGGLRFGYLDQEVEVDGALDLRSAALSSFRELIRIESEMRRIEAEMQDSPGSGQLEEYSALQERYEHEGGFEYVHRTESVLLGLGLGRDKWHLETRNLSGGERNRLGLARLLLSDADVLLLDEPTNHLDISAVEWLEGVLRDETRAFVVISHDRYFLDRICTRVIELEAGKTYSYSGNYSEFTKQAEIRREQLRKEHQRQQAFIAKTEAFVRKNIAGQKTKQAKSRRNLLARMARAEAPANKAGGGNFALRAAERAGNQVLTLEELVIGYEGRILAEGLDLVLLRGERLGVIGGNGTGKTTFLETLLGQRPALAGEVRWGAKTEVGYYAQNLEHLSSEGDVIGELRKVAPNAADGELRSFLARFLFLGEDVFKRVADLSGGEKGRLALAKLVLSDANVLLLDEPTNHLDISSREALEEALERYTGTIIFVSHDRYFLDRISDRVLDLGADGTELFGGNYSQYHQWLSDRYTERGEGREKEAVPKKADAHRAKRTRRSAMSKNEIRRVRERIGEIETELPEYEDRLRQIGFGLSKPEAAGDRKRFRELSQKYEDLESQIRSTYEEWEALLEKLEKAEPA